MPKTKFTKEFVKGLEKIRSLEIQGAQNVAKYSLVLMKNLILEKKNLKNLHKLLADAKLELFKTRPTEPAMRNALNYVLFSEKEDPLNLVAKIESTLEFFKKGEDHISELGSRLIRNGMVVYTHCHSSTVVNILKKAYDNGIKFEVCNTETRPRFQGKKTAKELAEYGIKVNHYVDSAARLAIKKSDLVFLGCDAITESKIYNKIGSELFAEVANKYDVPVYVCTNSWKYDPLAKSGYEEVIEERDSSEVWVDAPENVNIMNPAFEKVHPNLVTGIISELGVLSIHAFYDELRKKYKWM